MVVFRVQQLLPISPDMVECSTLPGEDILGGFAPDQGLRLGVVLLQVVADRVLEIGDVGMAAAADSLCDDLDEESLDQFHPGCAGGREM